MLLFCLFYNHDNIDDMLIYHDVSFIWFYAIFDVMISSYYILFSIMQICSGSTSRTCLSKHSGCP